MFIKISNLSEGVHNFEFDEQIKQIGLSEPFYDNFNSNIELIKSHSQIILNFVLKINANFECDRCGAAYTENIKSNFQIVYLFGKEPVDNHSINIIYLPIDADKIDISAELRDYALLSIPMKKLCREDCKGLCVNCGKDLNEGECNCEKKDIDPRWQPLQELKSKLKLN